MVSEIITQNTIFKNFILPFLIVFFIVFGVLEKTKVFGDKKSQLNALIAFVTGLIFVGTIFPKIVLENLILFLTIALVVLFVGLVLWGFISGGEAKIQGAGTKKFLAVLIFLSLTILILWSYGANWTFFEKIYNFLFKSSWSKEFWLNALFIGIIIFAVVFVLSSNKSSSS